MAEERPRRISVRLSPDEAWKVVEAAHTGILTTLRRDGVPVALPVWFVALDGAVYVRTPSTSKKVARARHDRRASFLVESGLRWAELEAVHLTGCVDVLDPGDELIPRVQAAMQAKYAGFTTARTEMPAATRNHYERAPDAFLRFTPDERIVSWDNARLGLA